MEKPQLNGIQKMILLCSMAQVSIEYIDDLLDDPEYNFHFVRDVKRNAKNHQKSLEGLLTRITVGQDISLKAQFVDNYIAMSNLIEEAMLCATREAKTQS